MTSLCVIFSFIVRTKRIKTKACSVLGILGYLNGRKQNGKRLCFLKPNFSKSHGYCKKMFIYIQDFGNGASRFRV